MMMMNPMNNNMMGMGMGMPMNNMFGMNMGMPMNMNNNMMLMNIMGGGNDEEWMKGFKMGVEEVKGNNEPSFSGGKINVIFNTTQGVSHAMALDFGTTVDQALKKYLRRVGKSELLDDLENTSTKICFLFNAQQLKFGDQQTIEKFFQNNLNPKIIVNDVHNLIGA
mgnify:CR=1 FL=1